MYHYVLFGEVSIQILCPIFNWTVWFFGVELYKFFINFGYEPLVKCITGKYVFPFSGSSFHFGDGFLCYAKHFSFCGLTSLFFLLFPLPDEIYQKKILLQKMSGILLFSSRIFMALSLTFKSLIHFAFILVHGVRRWSFLHIFVQFSQYIY